MKNIIINMLSIILFLNVSNTLAQEKTPVNLANQFSINFLSPSVQYEVKLGNTTSLVGQVGLLNKVRYSSFFGGFTQTLNPTLNIGFRKYYARRNVKKELLNNSGNYFGIISSIRAETFGFENNFFRFNRFNTPSYSLTPVWGIQRTYNNRIQLGASTGFRFSYNEYLGFGLEPTFDFQIGLIIK